MLSRESSFISLIYDVDVVRYFSSFEQEDGFLILHGDEKYLFVDKRYYYQALSNADANVVLLDNKSLESFIKDNNVNTVGLIYSLTSVSAFKEITDLGVKVEDIEKEVNLIRSVKTERELQLIKTAEQICEKSFIETLKFIKLGVTEKEVAAYLEYQFKLNGAEVTSF